MQKNKKEQNYKAIVLAAGVGSRINKITKTIPKTMIKINGKFIFEYILENLHKAKIKEVYLFRCLKRTFSSKINKKMCRIKN